jgi:putative lipoprotein
MESIMGNVAYRERVALPPDAVVRVELNDASRTDASSSLIAETTVPTAGRQVPISYTLSYDAAKIEQDRRYAVRAVILSEGRPIFESRHPVPVLTAGAGRQVNIIVQPTIGAAAGGASGVGVGGASVLPAASGGAPSTQAPAATSASSTAALEGTYWKLIELNGAAVVVMPNVRESSLILRSEDHRIVGLAGINRFAGTYTLKGVSLSFTPAAATMMAGPERLMRQERDFFDALEATRSYRIEGETLLLLDAGHTTVARLAATYL